MGKRSTPGGLDHALSPGLQSLLLWKVDGLLYCIAIHADVLMLSDKNRIKAGRPSWDLATRATVTGA